MQTSERSTLQFQRENSIINMNSNKVIFGSQHELRGVHLFRAISRKLGKHRRYDYEEDSTDSERSSSGSSSASCSDSMQSSESLRKMFQSLSVNNRSTEIKNEQPKRILRQPVSYKYVRGLSGLPTIRVPRNSACCPQAR